MSMFRDEVNYLLICVLLSLLLMVGKARAVSSDNVMLGTSQIQGQSVKLLDRLSTIFSSSYVSSLYQPSSPNYSNGLEFSLSQNLEYLGSNWGAIFYYSKDLSTYEKNGTLEDTMLYVSRLLGNINEEWSVSASLSGIVPTSKISREVDSLQALVALAPSLNYASSSGKYVLTFSPKFGKYFHQYDVSLTGSSNTSYYLMGRLGITYTPIDWLHLNILTEVSDSKTYEGNSKRQKFRSTFGLGFDLSSKLTLDLEILTRGNIYKDDGRSSNLSAIEDRSIFYATLSWKVL